MYNFEKCPESTQKMSDFRANDEIRVFIVVHATAPALACCSEGWY